jgi:DNA-binding CsgD family transcriptional regulator
MSFVNKLEKAQEAFRQRVWADAYNLFSASDHETPVKPEHLEQMAIAAYLIGKDSESVDTWTRAHQEFLNHDSKEQAARCAFWLGMQLLNKGDRARGSGWIARAGRLIDDSESDCPEQGFLLLPEALQLLGQGKGKQAYAKFSKVGEIGERFDNPDLIVLSRLGCGQSLIRQNNISEGTTLLDEAMIAVESDDISPIVIGIVYCAVIETCQKIYDFNRAQEWTEVLMHWCDAQPDMVPFRGQCLVRRAEIMQLHGNWSDAMAEVHRACEMFSRPPGESVAGLAFYCKGELHRLRGEFIEAEEAYGQANKWGKKPQPGFALLRLAQGKKDAAKKVILQVAEENQDPLARARMLPAYVEIMLTAEDPDKAKNASNELSKIAQDLNVPYLQALAEQSTGAVLIAQRKFRGALNKLNQAWKILQKFDAPYDIANIRVLRGIAYRHLDDEDSAVMEFNGAVWIFQQLGAAPDLAKIKALNRQTDSVNTHGLTRRELEVLRLIAGGKTNKEIASHLFISDRTVDRHVSNILMKLDVASRTEATSFAFKHNLI